MNFNLKIKIIKEFGTQADFAVAIGDHESNVSRVIKGRRELSEDKKSLWAKALNCKVSEIFERS